MYNLLVTNDTQAWQGKRYALDRARVGEYTVESLKTRYATLDEAAVVELTSFPALFAYEKVHGLPARVGRISRIRDGTAAVRIEFDLPDEIAPIPIDKVLGLARELDLGFSEMHRTHWAVKDVDLAEVLRDSGLVSGRALEILESLRSELTANSRASPVTDVIPDLDWYLSISNDCGRAPRCPCATVERCPRYFQSLSLLGRAGSTRIEQAEDERLFRFWQESDLWPTTREQETSVSHVDDDARGFINFCPEVSFDRFGYFASYLHRYADEVDLDIAHRRLAQSGALPNHWAWAWSTVTATHYTECPVYSVLIGGGEHDLIRLSGGQEASVNLWDQYGRKIVIGVIVAIATAGILALMRVIL